MAALALLFIHHAAAVVATLQVFHESDMELQICNFTILAYR